MIFYLFIWGLLDLRIELAEGFGWGARGFGWMLVGLNLGIR